ncbi:MAG TPA: DUF5399 family protein [Rhabdochlamydiaceae bacterium]|jgi:hypothetical protein
MKPVTIDNLDIKEHIRWAQDRAILDSSIVQESQSIAPYPDLVGISVIFPSQLEELFSWARGMHPWANFTPPENLFLFAKRFFSYRIFPHISCKDFSDEEDREEKNEDEEKEESDERRKDLIQQVLAVQKNAKQTHALFEKDKSCILSLLESIRSIDDMLAQISGCKLQYQKG